MFTLAMHELALMDSLVCTVSEQIGDSRVVSIRLRVGELTCVVPDALKFCFEVCTRGTALQGATLEIESVAGRARCLDCGAEAGFDFRCALCGCGSANLDVIAGKDLTISNVEVI